MDWIVVFSIAFRLKPFPARPMAGFFMAGSRHGNAPSWIRTSDRLVLSAGGRFSRRSRVMVWSANLCRGCGRCCDHVDKFSGAPPGPFTRLVLLGKTVRGVFNPSAETAACSITSEGQVTIPRALRQQLGLTWGSRVRCALVGDHIEVRPCKPSEPPMTSGFGLLHRQRPPVPVDIDPASLLQP